MHQLLKILKRFNTWLSWWRHQMMIKVTFSKFFIKTYSILSIQYIYKVSCKMDIFWDTACFFTRVNWVFQKSPTQVGLTLTRPAYFYLISIFLKIFRTSAGQYNVCIITLGMDVVKVMADRHFFNNIRLWLLIQCFLKFYSKLMLCDIANLEFRSKRHPKF